MTRLGELLVNAGKITDDQLENALSAQQTDGGRVGTHLVKMGFIDDDDLVEFLSQRYGVPAINLGEIEVDESIISIIPAEVARKYTILPVSKAGAKLTIAMVDPDQRLRDGRRQVHDRLQRRAGCGLGLLAARRHRSVLRQHPLHRAQEGHGGSADNDDADLEVLDEEEDLDLEALEAESEEAPSFGWSTSS